MGKTRADFELIEGFPEAVRMLKRSLSILVSLESEQAAAAIAMKLVDSLDSIIKRNFAQALSDIWSCSYAIQSIVYKSFAEKLGVESERAVAAKVAASDGDFEEAARQYMLASAEITMETGFEVLFMDGDR